MRKPLILIFLVLIIDQAIKIYLKTHFILGQELHVAGDWFILHFTENNGMAFGMEFAGRYGKLFLTTFRILAVSGIAWYLVDLVRKKASAGFIYSIALILAGAVGNIIDSVFYGVFFTSSECPGYAHFLPHGGGYAGFLHGKVVDMFYFPIIHGAFPDWCPNIPFLDIGPGADFMFFRPIFNFSDAAITVGVVMILLFQRSFFLKK